MNSENTPSLSPEHRLALSEFVRCLEARIQALRAHKASQASAQPNALLRQIEEMSLASGQSVFGDLPGTLWRHHPVPAGFELMLNDPAGMVTECVVCTLDELSEAINTASPELFRSLVNAERNELADWVETAFGLPALAEALRLYPTPLRMMVSIEKFLRLAEANC